MQFWLENLNEEFKHVNNDVIHYTNDLIKIIEKNDKPFDIEVKLINRNDFKIITRFIVDTETEFRNYGYFKKSNDSKMIGDVLTNTLLYVQLKLSENEINNISNNNKIRSLLNHELNHALEIYQYEKKQIAYRNSWNISKNYVKHREFASKWKYWDDFNHLIYLSLDHEMNSSISSLYEYDGDILKSKVYMDAVFMRDLKFDIFYNLFINKYSESDFINVVKVFCDDYNHEFNNDINYCKNLISKIIKSFNQKGEKIIKKINNLIKRIENDRNYPDIIEEKIINYSDYKKEN